MPRSLKYPFFNFWGKGWIFNPGTHETTLYLVVYKRWVGCGLKVLAVLHLKDFGSPMNIYLSFFSAIIIRYLTIYLFYLFIKPYCWLVIVNLFNLFDILWHHGGKLI